MSKQDYTAEHGPSWKDVEDLADEFERDHDCKVNFDWVRHTVKGGTKRTMVTLYCRTMENWPNGPVKCAKHVWWDRREFKTITALCYNMLLDRDNYLTKMREAAEEQAPLL